MKKRNILTPLENVEDVIETPHSMDQLSIRRMIQSMENMTEYQQNEIPCLPGIAIIQTLNKYLKNALISLLILTSELPWYFTGLYAFISNSGCDNADFRIMAEISFLYQCISYLFLPILIKKKLDRLSEWTKLVVVKYNYSLIIKCSYFRIFFRRAILKIEKMKMSKVNYQQLTILSELSYLRILS